MRNALIYMTTFLVLGIFIYSCAVFDVSYSKKPERVAEKFLNHFYKCEYEKAKKYSSSKTRQIIDLMDQLVAVSGQTTFPKDSKVVMLDTETKGDTAICNYFVNDVKNEIVLLKTDGKWLVDLKKETENKSGTNNFLNGQTKKNEENNNKK